MRFPATLLWINSVLFIVFGAAFLTAPEFFSLLATGSAPSTASALIDMRATYGGTALGIGFFFGFCACRPATVQIGLIASVWVLASIAAARLVGFVVDGSPNPFMSLFLATEMLFVVLGAIAIKGFEKALRPGA